MEPNFEDYSCEMVFGKAPPPAKSDEAARQPCLAVCPAGRAIGEDGQQCHKLRG